MKQARHPCAKNKKKMKDVFEESRLGFGEGEQGRKGRVRDWRNAGTRRTILEKHLNRLGLKERNLLFAKTVKQKILGKQMSLILILILLSCINFLLQHRSTLLCNRFI